MRSAREISMISTGAIRISRREHTMRSARALLYIARAHLDLLRVYLRGEEK
jgi:hypothetical protein